MKICRSTYRKGVAPDFPLLSRLSRKPKEMPLEFVKQVRDDVDKYPLSVLSIAEAALVTHVRKKIRPVYAITIVEHDPAA